MINHYVYYLPDKYLFKDLIYNLEISSMKIQRLENELKRELANFSSIDDEIEIRARSLFTIEEITDSKVKSETNI